MSVQSLPGPLPQLILFLDYDNLLPVQRTAGLLALMTKALLQLPPGTVAHRSRCDVRVYGGWYEGAQMTQRAQDVAVEIQRDFPAVIRLPGTSDVAVLVSAQLAVALLQEPGHHLLNTHRRKGKPANVRVEDPIAVGCNDPSCLLPSMKKMLRTGCCPKHTCPVATADVIYRHEQKTVDTMLSCDLIHAASNLAAGVVLISSDDDFLPPLRVVQLSDKGLVVRLHPKAGFQPANLPASQRPLIEMEL